METIKNKLIIISSDEAFSSVWHTQIQYAHVLSEFNKVVYINPPKTWNLKSLFIQKSEVTCINENLILYQYRNVLPVKLGSIATKFNDLINSKVLNKIFIKDKFASNDIIIWKFDPFRLISPSLRYWKSIYHVIDPFFKRKYDKIHASSSDLVIVTSPKFIDFYKKINANVIQIPQAFMKQIQSNNEKLKFPRLSNYFIIVGTFSEFIDYMLLQKIVSNGYNVLAIGPLKINSDEKVKQWEQLLNMQQFEYIGIVHFKNLDFYISKSLGGLICYDYISKGLELDKNSSPLKAINYLSNYKLIVSTIDVEIPVLKDKAIFEDNNQDGFISVLDKIYRNEIDVPKNNIEDYLESISYDNQIMKIEKHLHSN